jgi:cytochrome c
VQEQTAPLPPGSGAFVCCAGPGFAVAIPVAGTKARAWPLSLIIECRETLEDPMRMTSSFATSLTIVAALASLPLLNVTPVARAQAPEPAAADDGQAAFNNACRTCHTSKAGDNRLGPSLAGIVGRKAGQQSGFAYSASMKNSGVTWDIKTLDAFIANPDSVVAGNAMKPFTGISDAAVRAQIIKSLGGG